MLTGNRRYYLLLLLAVVTIGFTACNGGADGAPDISGIKNDLVTQRFDKDIYSIDTNHIGAGLQQLKPKYPDFLDFFLDTVMGFGVNGNYSDTSVAINQAVKEYLAYKDYRDLEAAINKAFPDTRALDEAIGNGFRYVKHYYPGFKTPRVYYINHILINLPAFCIDSTLSCVCLDMFLGADFQPYRSVGVPEYLNPHLSPKYVPVALFSALYEAKYPYRTADKTLLDLMIQKGKEQYFLHKVLPGTPDSVLFGFTGNQIEWCQKNEAFLYNYLIERNLLYSHEERAIMPYVNDGPFAHGIGSATDPGKPTPGNVGTWLGYRIVRTYAERHQFLTLPALMADRTEGAPFLEAANYKPR